MRVRKMAVDLGVRVADWICLPEDALKGQDQ